MLKPLSANPTKWSNRLYTIRRQKSTNCLSVFDHFVRLALKGLKILDTKKLLGAHQILRKFIRQLAFCVSLSLREKCSYSEFFCSVFSHIGTEFGEILLSLRIRSKCGKMRSRKTQNTDT